MLKPCCLCIYYLFVKGPPTHEEDLQELLQASYTEYHKFVFFSILFLTDFFSLSFCHALYKKNALNFAFFSLVKCILLCAIKLT